MLKQEQEALWRFWGVGRYWFGRRVTGETVRAGTYIAARNKASWHEESLI